MSDEKKQDAAILILSCDKNTDLWGECIRLFWKHWPDCPHQVYLGSNSLKFKGDDRVKSLLTHDDPDWSTSYTKILNQIPEKYIYVWLEDGLINSRVNGKLFRECFDLMRNEDAKHMHGPLPHADGKERKKKFGIYEKGMPYRVNVVGFWDKEYLLNLVIKGESAWDFEIMGSYRGSYDDGFYCLNEKLFDHVHVVEKGKWVDSSIKECENHDIKLNLKKREIISGYDKLKNKLKKIYFKLICKAPWKLRVKLINLLRKILISY